MFSSFLSSHDPHTYSTFSFRSPLLWRMLIITAFWSSIQPNSLLLPCDVLRSAVSRTWSDYQPPAILLAAILHLWPSASGSSAPLVYSTDISPSVMSRASRTLLAPVYLVSYFATASLIYLLGPYGHHKTPHLPDSRPTSSNHDHTLIRCDLVRHQTSRTPSLTRRLLFIDVSVRWLLKLCLSCGQEQWAISVDCGYYSIRFAPGVP